MSKTERVTFLLPPDTGDVFAAGSASGLVGQTTNIKRLDGSEAISEIVEAVVRDGRLAVTVEVPGGIDKAPREGA